MASQRVLVVSDGVAGHDRCSYGILSALRRFRGVDAVALPVKDIRGKPRPLKRTLARILPFPLFWNNFYRIGDRLTPANPVTVVSRIPEGPIDLVISAGPETAAANIALARHFGAKNIYFGHPEGGLADGFTLLLCPQVPKAGQHVAYALRPSELDATLLPEARAIVPEGDERTGALLIGGKSRKHSYSARDMEVLADRMTELAGAMPRLRWTVFDSRRTPKPLFARFTDEVKRSGRPIEIVRYSKGGLLSNASAFRSDLVLVTADSMSMISESVAARRPTGILFPDSYAASTRDRLEHDWLIAQRRAFALKFAGLHAEAILSALPDLQLLPGSQLEILYRTIARFGI